MCTSWVRGFLKGCARVEGGFWVSGKESGCYFNYEGQVNSMFSSLRSLRHPWLRSLRILALSLSCSRPKIRRSENIPFPTYGKKVDFGQNCFSPSRQTKFHGPLYISAGQGLNPCAHRFQAGFGRCYQDEKRPPLHGFPAWGNPLTLLRPFVGIAPKRQRYPLP